MGEGYVTERDRHEIVVQEPIDHKELQEAIFRIKLDHLIRYGREEEALKILLHNWAGHLATKINYDLQAGTIYGFEGPQYLEGSFGNSTRTSGYDSDVLRVNAYDISEYLKGKGIPVKRGREITDEHRRMLRAEGRLDVAKKLQGSHGLSPDIQDMIAGHMGVRGAVPGAGQGGGKLKRRMKKSKRSKRKGKSKKKSKRTKKQQRKR